MAIKNIILEEPKSSDTTFCYWLDRDIHASECNKPCYHISDERVVNGGLNARQEANKFQRKEV